MSEPVENRHKEPGGKKWAFIPGKVGKENRTGLLAHAWNSIYPPSNKQRNQGNAEIVNLTLTRAQRRSCRVEHVTPPMGGTAQWKPPTSEPTNQISHSLLAAECSLHWGLGKQKKKEVRFPDGRLCLGNTITLFNVIANIYRALIMC